MIAVPSVIVSGSIVPIDVVGIEPQADAREGVGLQVEVTHSQGLGDGGGSIVCTVTCLVGGNGGCSCCPYFDGPPIGLHLCDQAVELVKVTSKPELATAVGMKLKSPTDFSGRVPKEIVWSDLSKLAERVVDGAGA